MRTVRSHMREQLDIANKICAKCTKDVKHWINRRVLENAQYNVVKWMKALPCFNWWTSMGGETLSNSERLWFIVSAPSPPLGNCPPHTEQLPGYPIGLLHWSMLLRFGRETIKHSKEIETPCKSIIMSHSVWKSIIRFGVGVYRALAESNTSSPYQLWVLKAFLDQGESHPA